MRAVGGAGRLTNACADSLRGGPVQVRAGGNARAGAPHVVGAGLARVGGRGAQGAGGIQVKREGTRADAGPRDLNRRGARRDAGRAAQKRSCSTAGQRAVQQEHFGSEIINMMRHVAITRA